MDPFIGQIIMFGGVFAPQGWALCNGQLLAISQNQALFSILGTTYGGDGRTTFGLPDLRGRVPMHPGSGVGLTPRQLGEKGGVENVSLIREELPPHNHRLKCSSGAGTTSNPQSQIISSDPDNCYGPSSNGSMAPRAIGTTGDGQAHENMPPFACVNYIIALVGIYPSIG